MKNNISIFIIAGKKIYDEVIFGKRNKDLSKVEMICYNQYLEFLNGIEKPKNVESKVPPKTSKPNNGYTKGKLI